MMELPKAAFELLSHLEGCDYSKIIDLPKRYLNADLITFLDSCKAVDFQDVEAHETPKSNLWFSHMTHGYRPWREFLPEAVSQQISAVLVRITSTGRAKLAEQRVTKRRGKESAKKGAWFGNAVAVWEKHRDWNDARIAGEIGVSPSTLTRSEKWQTLRAVDRNEAPPSGGTTDDTLDSFTDDYRPNRKRKS